MAKGFTSACSFSPALLEPNVEKYKKVARIGEKRSPGLFRVKYSESGHELVAKVTDLEETDDQELKHLEKEVGVTRLLRHQNLLPFLATFLDHNYLWVVTPFCELGSASDLCQPMGLPEVTIAYVIRDVLLALEYLHRRGYIHRAVRGSHILVNQALGRCLLTGLKYCTSILREAKWQVAVHEFPTNAEPNLNWLSPELLEQNLLGYDAKSDIYSVGITCCELANGRVPFEHLHPTEMLLDKMTGNQPMPLDQTCSHLLEDMTQEEEEKCQVYKSRRFSESFHSFAGDLCLVFDPHKRPSASQLLNHSFFKQLKRAEPFRSLLLNIRQPLVYSTNSLENNVYSSDENRDEHFAWNFS